MKKKIKIKKAYDGIQKLNSQDITNGASAIGAVAGSIISGAASTGKYGAQKKGLATAGKALEYGAAGAQLGSSFGPLGTAIGAGVGALGGGIAGFIGAEKANQKAEELEMNHKLEKFNHSVSGIDITKHQKTQVMKQGGKAKQQVIEIEGKKTPEIHTDAEFNLKNLGTKPHSKGGTKVLAEVGDVVFPTQNNANKYEEIMGAIANGDKAKLKKEQAKLPKDGGKKYPGGTKKVTDDKTLVPTLVKNGGIGKTSVDYMGKRWNGLGNQVDQRKNYKNPYVADTWQSYMNGDLMPINDGKYPTPYVRGTGANGQAGTGAALAVNNIQPVKPMQGYGPTANLSNTIKVPNAPISLPPTDAPAVAAPQDKLNDLGLNNLGKYAGIFNNFAQGMKRPEEVDRHLVDPHLLKYQDRSEPLRKQSKLAEQTARASGRNLSGGNSANFRANAQSASMDNFGRQESINNNEMGRADNVDQYNVGVKNDVEKINTQLKGMYDDKDAQNRAARDSYRDQAFADVAKVSQVNEQMNNQKKYEDKYLKTLEQMGYNYGFDADGNMEWKGERNGGTPLPPNKETTTTRKVGNETVKTKVGSNLRTLFRRR